MTTTVGLKLEVNSFKVGKMRIRCVAELYGVFKATAETVLDEERPRLASILGTFSSAGKSTTHQRRNLRFYNTLSATTAAINHVHEYRDPRRLNTVEMRLKTILLQ